MFEILGWFFTLSYWILLNANQKHFFSYQETTIGSLEGLDTTGNGFGTNGWICPNNPPARFFCTYALLKNHHIRQIFLIQWRQVFFNLPSVNFTADHRYPNIIFQASVPNILVLCESSVTYKIWIQVLNFCTQKKVKMYYYILVYIVLCMY